MVLLISICDFGLVLSNWGFWILIDMATKNVVWHNLWLDLFNFSTKALDLVSLIFLQRNQSHGKILGTSKLLQGREFSGNIVSLKTGRHNFKEEFHKRLVSQPTVSRLRMVPNSSTLSCSFDFQPINLIIDAFTCLLKENLLGSLKS